MMLHLGGGEMIPLKNIVAILDLDAAQGQSAADFLQKHALPSGTRTAIVTNAYGKTVVHPSTISSLTLLRRSRDGAKADGQWPHSAPGA